mmetsp:Transcript_12984/g.22192  ORF Transcript_12984/g.22192 Transcript_12984/m.22192 type:complete len:184 (-) Transcript_12984:413-964(-)
MLEPDTLNVRAWALDSVDEQRPEQWRLEAVFDGLCGDRPAPLADAWECPKERTRVRCVFEPASGRLAPSSDVLVWHERCWSVSPKGELDARALGSLDPNFVSAIVGFEAFGSGGAGRRGEGAATDLTLNCGLRLEGEPGLLKLTLSSGVNARNGYTAIVLQRSWAGGSKYTNVDVLDDTTGDK